MDLINTINTLTPGIQTRFASMWDSIWQAEQSKYAPMMEFGVPSQGAFEYYAHFEAAPHARRWPRGEPRGAKGFRAVQYQVVNHDWKVGVAAHENDVMDDRTGSMEKRAMQAGTNAARIPIRVFYQLEESQTNPDLLPSQPNAPDGAGLFSATDGASAARFGVTGGNVLTGSGVANVSQIQTDYAAGIVRAKQFLDTEGQPYYPDGIEDQGITVVAGVANWFVIKKAFEHTRPVVVVSATGAEGVTASGVAAATPSNAVRDLNVAPVNLIINPYKTTNDWSMWFHGAPVKPIFQQVRQGLQYTQANRHNNGDCLRDKTVGWYWDWREGYGLNLPVGCVLIDNS